VFGDKIQKWKDGGQTRRCKAVTVEGPCRNWTHFEFCHAHEWKVNQIEMSTRQAFLMLLPQAAATIKARMEEADPAISLRAAMYVIDKGLGNTPMTDGLTPSRELADLPLAQLVERAQKAIAELQATGEEPLVAAAAAGEGSENASDGPSDAAPPAGSTAAPPAGSTPESPFSGLSEPLS
jgi:hypothetical protein